MDIFVEDAERIPVSGHTSFYGLLGHPVAHSLSPAMHNESFRCWQMDAVYLCFDVEAEHFDAAVEGLRCCGIKGLNLTMPHKNRMAEIADELSPAARLTGAVNTVLNQDGRLIGHNTDGKGFMLSLAEAGFDAAGKRMTILGGGGAASAICAQAALDGVKELRIFARPESRFHQRTLALAEAISADTGCSAVVCDLGDQRMLAEAIASSDILINGSSVGMSPAENASLIEDPTLFRPELFVADVIYQPRQTRFLKLAKEAGCQTMNGMYMLLYQGAEAFRIWTGKAMPTERIRQMYFSD